MKKLLVRLAKKYLENNGYYTRNLWTTEDVTVLYDCDNDIAMEILDQAITNDNIIVDIHMEIMNAAERIKLNHKFID
jgi:hypothetical protein